MVTEFAEIDVKPGSEAAFIAGVQASVAVFANVPGCHGIKLHRSVEQPLHFVLNVGWDSVAVHQAFRDSPAFQQWRGNVGACFAAPPNVWHGEAVVVSP